MDTEKQNVANESGNESDKSSKAKEMAGKAARFAAAAGAGVAGTMAAQAMTDDPEPAEETAVADTPTGAPEKPSVEEPRVEEPEEFDPNDIIIEYVEEGEIEEGNPEDESGKENTPEGPQPITLEMEEPVEIPDDDFYPDKVYAELIEENDIPVEEQDSEELWLDGLPNIDPTQAIIDEMHNDLADYDPLEDIDNDIIDDIINA